MACVFMVIGWITGGARRALVPSFRNSSPLGHAGWVPSPQSFVRSIWTSDSVRMLDTCQVATLPVTFHFSLPFSMPTEPVRFDADSERPGRGFHEGPPLPLSSTDQSFAPVYFSWASMVRGVDAPLSMLMLADPVRTGPSFTSGVHFAVSDSSLTPSARETGSAIEPVTVVVASLSAAAFVMVPDMSRVTPSKVAILEAVTDAE